MYKYTQLTRNNQALLVGQPMYDRLDVRWCCNHHVTLAGPREVVIFVCTIGRYNGDQQRYLPISLCFAAIPSLQCLQIS